MSELFSERPFVAGSLTGIRSFKIDRFGRLRATQINVVWTPGENLARCMKDQFNTSSTFLSMLSLSIPKQIYKVDPVNGMITPVTEYDEPKVEPAPKTPDHRVATLGCTCGFYAFFDNDENQWHEPGQIKGLIEGYGLTTVGTRGFRCEKAKIRALILPERRRTTATDAVQRNYPDLPVFASRRLAFAEFPLTPPARPTPETDKDFWTREAL